jgi:hypothetical protein
MVFVSFSILLAYFKALNCYISEVWRKRTQAFVMRCILSTLSGQSWLRESVCVRVTTGRNGACWRWLAGAPPAECQLRANNKCLLAENFVCAYGEKKNAGSAAAAAAVVRRDGGTAL